MPKTVFVLSDSTGDTAEKVVRAALLQFDESKCDVRVFSRVRLEKDLQALIEKATEIQALVVFTVVDMTERELLWDVCRQHGVEPIDLIGGLMTRMASYLNATPAGVPGRLHSLSEEYFRRIEAVEFAVKNDDGSEPRNLPKADLILVGISRTSKTPLSTYLAQKGLCVANVPVVLGIDPPKELEQCNQDRIYGLLIQPDVLSRIRQVRLNHLGMPPDSSYAERSHIQKELSYAREIFRQHPNWPVIDVTGKAIEETAADILRVHKDRNSN